MCVSSARTELHEDCNCDPARVRLGSIASRLDRVSDGSRLAPSAYRPAHVSADTCLDPSSAPPMRTGPSSASVASYPSYRIRDSAGSSSAVRWSGRRVRLGAVRARDTSFSVAGHVAGRSCRSVVPIETGARALRRSSVRRHRCVPDPAVWDPTARGPKVGRSRADARCRAVRARTPERSRAEDVLATELETCGADVPIRPGWIRPGWSGRPCDAD